MSIKITIPGASFSDENIVGKVSFNSVRNALSFEYLPGLSADMSITNLVSGGEDGAIFGAPTFARNYMTTGGNVGMTMPSGSSAEETLVLITERITGQNPGINNYNVTNFRELGCHANQWVIAGGGSGAQVTQSISTHALGVPYFVAARFISETGSYKLYWGKAGVLSTKEVVGGTIPSPVPSGNYHIGNKTGIALNAANNVYYAARYSRAVDDEEVKALYADARDRFIAMNSDF